ncbi:winged helix-turn-helix domain-containing protein [Halomarina pelagica]|uniref:winged helix-turn-helix domain-containing protein n=1 Tax=Halomarina pelagica TaxID=2961599 RepID=UPI0020C4DB9D|nr:helix-turn-helix domain-containing protein [Halomarina sp. BND7]
MASDPRADDAPRFQDVLDALDDPDCRAIVEQLREPMTASELAEASGVPLSTTYRKLDLLTDAALLDERLEIRPNGRHRARYVVAFDEVRITLTDDRTLDAEIKRRTRTPDERLSELWAEVRKETQ